MNMRASVIDLPPARIASRYLACLRLPEIVVLQGSPLLGVAYATARPGVEDVAPIAILIAANILLVAHIFMLNDWSGLTTDVADPNRAATVFTTRGVDRREMSGVMLFLLVVSLFLFTRLGAVTLGLAFAIAVLSALYSLPISNWKGKPILNSVAHIAGGALHFFLGYSVMSAIDSRGLAMATFFGLTFAAGHLTQEIRDYQSDVHNAISTNAVIFGRRRTFVASVMLFTLAYVVLFILALEGVIPRSLTLLIALYPVHLRWSLDALGEGLTHSSIHRLQTRYRALYAVIGLAMVAALFQ
jgi:4-hydroxybenzoate polyprenyltransferase